MGRIAFLIASLVLFGSGRAIAAPDDFARVLAGPWGRVDTNWQPYIGVLAKNSCPTVGITRPQSVGLFGEGGSMWIEAGIGGAITLHDGASLPRTLSLVRMEGASSATYSGARGDRRLTLVAADRITEELVPPTPDVPAAHFVRCKIKKK